MTITTGGIMNEKMPPNRRLPEEIRIHLQNQQESTQTIKDHCHKNGIREQTFYAWRKRYKKQNLTGSATQKPRISFSSIGMLNTLPKPAPLFDIRFSSGTAVSVYRGTTVEELKPFIGLISGNTVC
jgi:transposase-like protein